MVALYYADTSALVRAYFADEVDHSLLRELLLEDGNPVVTSEITRVEIASAVRAASSGGRLRRWRALLARIDADCGAGGPVMLLALRLDLVLPAARSLVLDHGLRTLDALHLAVAIEQCPILVDDGEITFVTRDRVQAAAAEALGFLVA